MVKNGDLNAQNSGAVIWLMGLAGSGKSTIAHALTAILKDSIKDRSVIYLDGDGVRELFGADDYSRAGRVNISLKRAKLAKLLAEQGVIIVVSAISMFDEVYDFNKKNLPNYFEVYIKCDFEELYRRDQKGLYSQNVKNVVGVDISYNEPKADLIVDNTERKNTHQKAKTIFNRLKSGPLARCLCMS